jgi:hypothetical protein
MVVLAMPAAKSRRRPRYPDLPEVNPNDPPSPEVRAYLRAKVKAAHDKLKAKGQRIGGIPWGWTIDPKDKTGRQLVPNPKEREITTRIVAMAAREYSQREICEELTDLGFRTRTGHAFTQGVVWRILDAARAEQALIASTAPADGFYADKATGRVLVKLPRGRKPPANEGGSAPEPRPDLSPLLAQTLAQKWAAKGYSPEQIVSALAARDEVFDVETVRGWILTGRQEA